MKDEKINSEGMSFKFLLKKLDNFWYHYKIQTIIALVLVTTLIVCGVQMITRENYDYCVLYAGSHPVMAKSLFVKAAFEEVASDRDNNGKVAVALDDITVLSPEEQQAAMEEGVQFNAAFIQQSLNEYYQQLAGGEVVVCMLSPYMYQLAAESDMFMPLADVFDTVPESAYDKCAILLSKTEFGQYFDGINDMPDDTLICALRFSYFGQLFKGKAKAQDIYEANLELFRAIIDFEAPEDTSENGEPSANPADTTQSVPSDTSSPDTDTDETEEIYYEPEVLFVTSIVDRTELEELATDDALEGFYSDGEYDYYFSSFKSQYIEVYYSDGTIETVKDALAAGHIAITDLDCFGISYYKEPRGSK